MGNVNNCLTNPFEYTEVTIRPEKNLVTDKTFNTYKDYDQRKYLYGRKNLDIIKEEESLENYSQQGKQPEDRSSSNQIRENNSFFTKPKDMKLLEKNFNITYTNNLRKNNNQDTMIIDNKVLFNSTRKSNHSLKNNDNGKFNMSEKNKQTKNNINSSDFETNKLVNSQDESDNLIVLEYNRPETLTNNKNIDINKVNGYSNDDTPTPKKKELTNKINIKDIKNNNDGLLQDNININLRDSSNTIKNQQSSEYSNNLKTNTPYIKPRFNSNYNDNHQIENKNNIYINKKKFGLNQIKDNKFYYNSKGKAFKIIKKKPLDNQNTNINKSNNISNNRYENNMTTQEKYNTQNINNNYQNNQNEKIKLTSGSRKLNSEQDNNQLSTQRQYIQNSQVINEQIHYNNNLENDNSDKIIENPIFRNNKTNPNINKGFIQYNEIKDMFPSKSQDLLMTKNEDIIQKEENMTPDERILYQSATMDNLQEEQNNILFQSSSVNNNHIDLNNLENQEITNGQENQKNDLYGIGQTYQYSQDNEQAIILPPIFNKKYDYNEIIRQQAEQEKNNPEYEQTQQAQEENDFNNFQKKVNSKIEEKEPKDKDSESETEQKMLAQTPTSKEYQEIKNYNNHNQLVANDRITFKNDDNSYNNQNVNIENEPEINNINQFNNNKKMVKRKININEVPIEELKEMDLNNEEEKSPDDHQFYENPLTPSKPEDEETPYNKKQFIQKIIDNHSENAGEIEDDKNIDKENEYMKELECQEFRDFSPDGWQKFYPNERFFKFPKEGIIHDQLIINNEEIYKGDINKKREKHGFGKFISPSIRRIGMWRNDKFTGWGREIRLNGDIFEGKFVNGQLNGKGIHKNIFNKTTYIGDYLNSMRHGKGELYTNEYHYQGNFNYNKFEGQGKIEIYNEGEYVGTFKDNVFEGKGMLKWKDGRYYNGGLSKGKMNGYGEETFTDGSVYKGNFVNGFKEGKGKIISPQGEIMEVEFKKGQIIKKDK